MDTPIAFLIYRRPETTRRVFERIAQAKPKQLFVVADGARNSEEAVRCQQTRAIIDQVNWDCDVKTNYADHNMGLRKRISSGLDWVFEQVEEAIILEDDCLPHPTFFRFCEELLAHYRDDARVMHISGDNFGFKRPMGIQDSYYFSMFAHIWGWATWRRAWEKYDVNMTSWSDNATRQSVLSQFSTPTQQHYWTSIFNLTTSGRIQTWDYQWVYACIRHNGLCVLPYENQISNIGMGADSTNTKNITSPLANLPTKPMSFPLIHPNELVINTQADAHIAQLAFRSPPLIKRLLGHIKRSLIHLFAKGQSS